MPTGAQSVMAGALPCDVGRCAKGMKRSVPKVQTGQVFHWIALRFRHLRRAQCVASALFKAQPFFRTPLSCRETASD